MKKKTHDEFVKEINILYPDLEVVGLYINRRTPIKVKCKKCGFEWERTPKSFYNQNAGCKKCRGYYRTTQEYQTLIDNKNIDVIDDYVDVSTKIKHRCRVCKSNFYIEPNRLISSDRGCPVCGMKRKSQLHTKTQEQYIQNLLSKNIDITPLEKYSKANTKILHKCNKCGNEWYVKPADVLSGEGCPNCNLSKGELAIKKCLQDMQISFIQQYRFNDCRNNKPLPFDFYLPDYNICIEYDGELHYMAVDYFGGEEALQNTRKRDKIKDNYCKTNNIKLLRISYQSFNDIEKILSEELF